LAPYCLVRRGNDTRECEVARGTKHHIVNQFASVELPQRYALIWLFLN